jgi:hypothetical protein
MISLWVAFIRFRIRGDIHWNQIGYMRPILILLCPILGSLDALTWAWARPCLCYVYPRNKAILITRCHCWNTMLQLCEWRSFLEHTVATVWTEVIVATMISDTIVAFCIIVNLLFPWFLLYVRRPRSFKDCRAMEKKNSLGCPSGVNFRDVAWRTPLELQCIPKSTPFQCCL